MTATEYVLENFVADLRRIVGASEDEAAILAQVQPLARRFAGERSWLCEAMYGADPALGFGTTLLHAEVDHSLFVVVDSWLPGRGVPPHDHATWAVVVGVDGSERNIFWQRLDDATRPGYAELQRIGEQSIGPGETLPIASGSIHSVINETPHTRLSFHVYGRHLNHAARRQFDPEHNRERPFIIDAR